MVSFLLALARKRVTLSDQIEKVFDTNVHDPGLGEQDVDALGQGLKALRTGHSRGAVRDVSAGGLFFYAEAPFDEQQEIEVTMTLPPELTHAHVQVVCWAKILRIEPPRHSSRDPPVADQLAYLDT